MAEPDAAAVRREIAARRRAQAFQMRREGATMDAIAARLNVSRSTVRRMIAREVTALSAEMQPDERRVVHVEALMDLWKVLHPAATQGDMAAIDRFLRVEERLSRLLGLDRRPDDAINEQALRILVGSDGEEASEEAAAPPARRFTREPAGVAADDAWDTGDGGS
jgi:DNA-binding transcriptional regulator LsrR (DeoR family)